MTHAKHWRWMAPLGLSLVGLGLCLLGEAISLKSAHASWLSWGTWGTLALVCVNAGLSIFGDAVKRRFWQEWEERETKSKTSN